MKKTPPDVARPPIQIVENESFSFEPIFFMMGIGLLILFMLVGVK